MLLLCPAPEEFAAEPHLASRDLFFQLPSPRGPIPQFRTPVTPQGGDFSPPPRQGEHTRAILREGGFSDGEIDALIRSGAGREAG